MFVICKFYVPSTKQNGRWNPLKSQEIPTLPWSRISVDLFKHDGKHYLVSVDHYMQWLFWTRRMASLKNVYSCSDNRPQFDNQEYAKFNMEYGFKSIKFSAYHSKGKGKAESAVKVANNILKNYRWEDPYVALLAYRNTPQYSIGLHIFTITETHVSKTERHHFNTTESTAVTPRSKVNSSKWYTNKKSKIKTILRHKSITSLEEILRKWWQRFCKTTF